MVGRPREGRPLYYTRVIIEEHERNINARGRRIVLCTRGRGAHSAGAHAAAVLYGTAVTGCRPGVFHFRPPSRPGHGTGLRRLKFPRPPRPVFSYFNNNYYTLLRTDIQHRYTGVTSIENSP